MYLLAWVILVTSISMYGLAWVIFVTPMSLGVSGHLYPSYSIIWLNLFLSLPPWPQSFLSLLPHLSSSPGHSCCTILIYCLPLLVHFCFFCITYYWGSFLLLPSWLPSGLSHSRYPLLVFCLVWSFLSLLPHFSFSLGHFWSLLSYVLSGVSNFWYIILIYSLTGFFFVMSASCIV